MDWVWPREMVKSKTGYLNNPFNHNWELVFLNQTPIQLQYNSAQIKKFTIQYNTILKLENVQQLNTIRAPHNCIEIQFTLNWPTLPNSTVQLFDKGLTTREYLSNSSGLFLVI